MTDNTAVEVPEVGTFVTFISNRSANNEKFAVVLDAKVEDNSEEDEYVYEEDDFFEDDAFDEVVSHPSLDSILAFYASPWRPRTAVVNEQALKQVVAPEKKVAKPRILATLRVYSPTGKVYETTALNATGAEGETGVWKK